MTLPSWATPKRRKSLVKLWELTGNQCLQGHTTCPIREHYRQVETRLAVAPVEVQVPCVDTQGEKERDDKGEVITYTVWGLRRVPVTTEVHRRLFDHLSEDFIAEWKADDRTARSELARREAADLHHMPDNRGWGRRFDPVDKDLFFARQPSYYPEGIGISGLTFHRVAKVRVASSPIRLFVDCQKLSYNARKKLRRKGIIATTTDDLCRMAAEQYSRSLV